MMRLRTLWGVDRTIDAAGGSPIADAIAARWDHEPGSVRHVRSSANFVYTLRRAGERAFLRFAASDERPRPAIEAEVALLGWLGGRGIPRAAPLPSRAGALVETVATPAGTFHAVLFAALEGEQPELDALDPGRLRAWGAALGRLHAAAQRPDAPPLLARPTLLDRLVAARGAIPAAASDVLAEHDRLAAALAALPTTPDRHGLLHGDCEPDNLVWRGAAVALLDFDGCAHGPYPADLAFALRDLLDPGATPADPAVAAFLAGYRAHAPLADADLADLPLFSRLARLLDYAAIARSRDLPPGGDYPDWLTRLDARFAARMAASSAALARG